MSDSIIRLRIDSQEYDNKLKRAAEGLSRYADECRKVGGTMEVVEKETLDYVRAVGQMDTKSRTATGSLAEMKKTFTELGVQYKNLTEAEKNSPYGRALAQSLEELKARITGAQGKIKDVTSDISGTNGLSGALESIAGKFGLSTSQLSGFGVALTAGSAALQVAKDAFMASDANIDAWGQTVDTCKSLYEGFLIALNTGDFSGFYSHIDGIIAAARKAYDELDRLGTLKTINSPQMSAQTAENERMRAMIQTRRYIAPMDGRAPQMASGTLLSEEFINNLKKQLMNGVQRIADIQASEVQQANRAIDAVYQRQANELSMTVDEFRKGTRTMAEFEKRLEGGRQYEAFEKMRRSMTYNSETGEFEQRNLGMKNPHEAFRAWSTFNVDGERYAELVQLIQQRDQQMQQVYSTQSGAYRAVNRVEGITSRMGGGKKGDEAIIYSKESVGGLTLEMQKLVKLQQTATNTVQWEEYADKIKEVSYKIRKIKGDFELKEVKPISMFTQSDHDAITADEEKRRKALQTMTLKSLKLPEQQKGKEVSVTDEIGKMSSGIGQMVSGLQQMGVEIPEELRNIFNVVNGFVSVLTGISSLLTIIATIQGIKATPVVGQFLAGGGMLRAATGLTVPGTSFSGDNIPALLNSGEVILNRAQQGNIAAQLETPSLNNLHLETYLDGQAIKVVLNNSNKAMGYGQFMSSRTRGRNN